MKDLLPPYEQYREYLNKHPLHTIQPYGKVQADYENLKLWIITILAIGIAISCVGTVFGLDFLFDSFFHFVLPVLFILLIIGIPVGIFISYSSSPQSESFPRTQSLLTDIQHDENLQVFADLLQLKIDQMPACSLQAIQKALYPYWFEDYKIEIIGSLYGKIQDRMGEITFLQKLFPSVDEQEKVSYSFAGYGLLAIFPLKSNFSSATIICRDRQRIWPKYLKNWQKATLESIMFEKEFDVFTTSQVEARQILTPDIMDILTQRIKQVAIKNFAISFSQNQLFVLLHDTAQWVSPQFHTQLQFLLNIPSLFNFKGFPYEWDTPQLYQQRKNLDKENDRHFFPSNSL